MTKNKAMRLGSVMLVLALLTTCAISGTFAKYTASSETNDTARVAYWGFSNSETTTLDLFNYTDANVKVSSTEVDDVTLVVAPGTSNSKNLTFNYNAGTSIKAPEVAYTFNVEATNSGDTTFLDGAKGFNWTLTVDGTETKYDKTADLLSALNALSVSDKVSAGSLPSTIATEGELKTFTIGWKWDFTDESQSKTDDSIAARDTEDTTLGNAAEADLQNVKLNIKVTATQVD